MASQRRRLAQKGVSLIVGTASMVLLIPSAGLSIDAALLYYTKARLQGAVDGAALGAARALSLGSTTSAQATSAKQNAVNWFYANFPSTLWGTSNTQMDQSMVTVQDDPNNPHLQTVAVSANTTVPTIFMRWFNMNSTLVAATGTASRRDTVMMLVLDRSFSMNQSGSCPDLIASAKLFTGQFEVGRDRIGLVTFSDGAYIASPPTTDFRNALGYNDGITSGSGAIDNIVCNGGTGTAGAISLGYNELYKLNQPGAFNVLLLETDGLPNTLTMNFWDSTTSTYALDTNSSCQDNSGKTKSGGGWANAAAAKDWPGLNGHAMGPNGFIADIPKGAIGAIYSTDPTSVNGVTGSFGLMGNPWHTSSNEGLFGNVESSVSGCAFAGSGNYNKITDIGTWLPATDVYGNSVLPSTNPYISSVAMTNGQLMFSNTQNTAWLNFHKAAVNATDNAAYRARTNGLIAATVFVIGLGGNTTGVAPIDHTLLQRVANDPAADAFNTPPKYTSCATTTGCVNYTDQPQGTYIYSTDKNELRTAFLRLSSQILRLSK
ncbi:MAG: VWA domain-containing protein [Acidobacteriia bacterium]|nr:VWA domain-containing protein [Terriglobia bacterium]